MSLSDRAEEILEALWEDIESADKETWDVRLLKDDAVIGELEHSGYVRAEDRQIRLTEKGREEARSCVRRHRLAERLLVDVLDCRTRLVHETSCRFEHLLHKGLDENVCTLLGHPKTCPHGKPIPEGKCCLEARTDPRRAIMPLTELEVDHRARVAYLQTHDHEALQKAIAIGVLPNTEIRLIQKFPSYVFVLGKSQFAVDQELASHIYVRTV